MDNDFIQIAEEDTKKADLAPLFPQEIRLFLQKHEFKLLDSDGFPEIEDLRSHLGIVSQEIENIKAASPEKLSEFEKLLVNSINDDLVRLVVDEDICYPDDFLVNILEPKIMLANRFGYEIKYKQKEPSTYEEFFAKNEIESGILWGEYSVEKQQVINILAKKSVFLKKWNLEDNFSEFPHYNHYERKYKWKKYDLELFKKISVENLASAGSANHYIPALLTSIYGTSQVLGFDNSEFKSVVEGFFFKECLKISDGGGDVYKLSMRFSEIREEILEERAENIEGLKEAVKEWIINRLKIDFHDSDVEALKAQVVSRMFLTSGEYLATVCSAYIEGICQQGNFKEPDSLKKFIKRVDIDTKKALKEIEDLPKWLKKTTYTFEINTIEDLVEVVSHNIDLFRFIVSSDPHTLSLSRQDIEVVKTLPINNFRAEQLRRNGFDFWSVNTDTDYKEMYQALILADEYWIEDKNSQRLNFEIGAKIFGYKNMFELLGSDPNSRKIVLESFNHVISFFRQSGLTADDFYSNILLPVSVDQQIYTEAEDEEGVSQLSHIPQKQLVYIISHFDFDCETQIMVASKLADIPEIKSLIPKLKNPKKEIFSSWSNLKDFWQGRKQLQKAVEINSNISQYPKNADLFDLFNISQRPQVGDRFLRSLYGLKDFDYKKQIIPLMSAQGEGAFLYLENIKTILKDKPLSESERHYIVQVAKRHGTQARNILQNIIMRVDSIDSEKDKIDQFVTEIGITDFDLYKKYSSLYSSGDLVEIEKLKQSVMILQQKIYSGEITEIDLKDHLYEAVSYFTFPPAIGITQQEYHRLNTTRPDRREDVPKDLDAIQYTHVELKTGRYFIDEDKELELENWDILGKVIRRVNREEKDSSVSRIDDIKVAENLVEIFKQGGIKTSKQKADFYEGMYKYHLSHGGAKLDDSYQLTLDSLMVYKEFIGEKIRNNLIRDCLVVYAKERPVEMEELIANVKNRSKNQPGDKIGTLKSLLKGVKAARDEVGRKKTVERIDTFLAGTGLSYELIKDKKIEEYQSVFIKDDGVNPEELVFKKISSVLISDINKSMRQQVEKFEFGGGVEASSETLKLDFIISKKKEHGVAGYTMGVCVTPDEQLWNDPSFWNGIFFDMESKQSVGGVHFLIREDCLTLPGINPSLELLATVDQEEIFDRIIEIAKNIQRTLGLKKLLIPIEPEIHSNRTQIQEVIRRKNYPEYSLNEKQPFSYSPHPYSIQRMFEVS